MLAKYNFTKIFDLQNSSRTRFYKKFIINSCQWSSSETSLEPGQKKSDFDKEPVLDRFQVQLIKNNIPINNTKKIDLSWAISDLSRMIKQYANNDYILVFPFVQKNIKEKSGLILKI